MTITNWGVVGNPSSVLIDPETGWPAPSHYTSYSAVWVGAIVGKPGGVDSLVSTGYTMTELYPDSYHNNGDFIDRSNDKSSPNYDPEAISPQDFTCIYTDTLADLTYVPFDLATMRPHKPLNIRVRQDSYVWPYEYSKDFIIIQYWITNMGSRPLRNLRVGFLVHPRVQNDNDEMVGFLTTVPSISGYGFEIPAKTAWWADADGWGDYRGFYDYWMPNAMALRILGTGQPSCSLIADSLEYSFNWWAPHENSKFDWGPQRLPGDRSMSGAYGRPQGDAQRYRFMADQEIDYDQYLANEEMPGWIPSPGIRATSKEIYNIANGHSVQLLLSVGPFELEPGDSIPLGIAIALGDNFHTDPDNSRNLGGNPEAYYNNLNFNDLIQNIQWAAYIYDNPGIDTDNDGCRGSAWADPSTCRDTLVFVEEECIEDEDTIRCYYDFWEIRELCDSFYYAGDGIPDLKGPPSPPSPIISVQTEPKTIHIEWDGREAEPFIDPFLQCRDFEGYNVYLGIGHDPNTLDLMASWDLVNFDRYRYDPEARPSHWVNHDPPFTIDQLCELYGGDFNPHQYVDNFSYFEDNENNRFFFKPHGGNRGNEYDEHGAIFPNPIQYTRTDSSWNEGKRIWEYFGHYECTIENLLPSQPYYVAVTAFDGGLIGSGLEPLESSRQANLQLAYPSYSPDYVVAKRMKVSVYPNPYKINAGYRERRFEDPNREGFKERTRRIHFVNLPPKATIKIYSLDGDLIREIRHPESRFSDTPSHAAWDLISRNTQAVTSGIYLYSVESDWGTQIGKIVIIK